VFTRTARIFNRESRFRLLSRQDYSYYTVTAHITVGLQLYNINRSGGATAGTDTGGRPEATWVGG